MAAPTAIAEAAPRAGRLSVFRPPPVSLVRAFRLWRRNITLYRRTWIWVLLPNFFQPFFYLVAIGMGLGLYVGRQISGVKYTEFISPGLAAMAAMFGAVFELTFNTYGKINWSRMYESVITTPLEPEDVAAGEIMWAISRSLINGGAFFIVMLGFGYVHHLSGILALPAIGLVGLAMGLVALLFTDFVTNMDAFSYFFNLFVTPLFLFSGVFFPIAQLPALARKIAWFTPLHHGVEMLRALTLTGNIRSAGGHALWLAVFCVVLLPPAINLFKRKLIT
jgi:lipooligosaccharide transport system permease protein